MAKLTKEELGSIIMSNKNMFYHVAKSILPNDADCSDAISEMILKGYSKLDKLKDESSAKAWLVRILINECYNIMRAPRIDEIPENYEAESGYYIPDREEYGDLYAALYELPDKLRTAMVLYYMEGYQISEIANMLSCTQSAVKNRLLRARKQMKEMLNKEEQRYA